jgi:hypothetical protein
VVHQLHARWHLRVLLDASHAWAEAAGTQRGMNMHGKTRKLMLPSACTSSQQTFAGPAVNKR